MSKMMRVVVRRGGRRVVCFRRRPQVRSVSPESLWPVEPIKAPVSEQVRELVKDVRSGVARMWTKKGRRGLRGLMKQVVNRGLWWWRRIRTRVICPEWLLRIALDGVHRCQGWWRELRVRMLIRRCRWRWWLLDWLADRAMRGKGLGRLLTCACT